MHVCARMLLLSANAVLSVAATGNGRLPRSLLSHGMPFPGARMCSGMHIFCVIQAACTGGEGGRAGVESPAGAAQP